MTMVDWVRLRSSLTAARAGAGQPSPGASAPPPAGFQSLRAAASFCRISSWVMSPTATQDGPVGAVVAPVEVDGAGAVQAPDRFLRALHRPPVEAVGVERPPGTRPGRWYRDGPAWPGARPPRDCLVRFTSFSGNDAAVSTSPMSARPASRSFFRTFRFSVASSRPQSAQKVGAHAFHEAADAHGVPGGGAQGQEPGGEVGEAAPSGRLVAGNRPGSATAPRRWAARAVPRSQAPFRWGVSRVGRSWRRMRRRWAPRAGTNSRGSQRIMSALSPAARGCPRCGGSRSRYCRATRWTSSAVTPWMPSRYSFIRRHPPVIS